MNFYNWVVTQQENENIKQFVTFVKNDTKFQGLSEFDKMYSHLTTQKNVDDKLLKQFVLAWLIFNFNGTEILLHEGFSSGSVPSPESLQNRLEIDNNTFGKVVTTLKKIKL